MLGQKLGLKRNHKSQIENSTRKKAKRTTTGLNDLPWKTIKHTSEATLGDFDDGILELEEVEGVDIEYEGTGAGKIAKFNVCHIFRLLYSMLFKSRL